MHLLCINLLVLVLLPSSLSCEGKAEPAAVRDHYIGIVKTRMDNIKDELQNLSCGERKHKIANCTTANAYDLILDLLSIASNGIVKTLLRQACEMHRLHLQDLTELATIVQNSIRCTCPTNTIKDPSVTSQQQRTARNPEKKKMKKLCKAKAILSSMTLCYERLNAERTDARN